MAGLADLLLDLTKSTKTVFSQTSKRPLLGGAVFHGTNSSDLAQGASSDSNDTIQFLRWSQLGRILHASPDWKVGGHANKQKPKIILMDESCSALDPIATARIEDLITALKQDYTIVIVTHNMQQATRVSTRTAFFYLGELTEYDETAKIFGNPSEKQTEDYMTGRFG